MVCCHEVTQSSSFTGCQRSPWMQQWNSCPAWLTAPAEPTSAPLGSELSLQGSVGIRSHFPSSHSSAAARAIHLPCPLLCLSIANHLTLAALLTTISVTQTAAELDGWQRWICPTAIDRVGRGRRGEELATCTHKTQNFAQDGKAGEVRTKLLEKTFSEDNKHIFAARKEGSPALSCSHSRERQACCH